MNVRLDEGEQPVEKILLCQKKMTAKEIQKVRITLELIEYFDITPVESRRMFEAMEAGFFCSNL